MPVKRTIIQQATLNCCIDYTKYVQLKFGYSHEQQCNRHLRQMIGERSVWDGSVRDQLWREAAHDYSTALTRESSVATQPMVTYDIPTGLMRKPFNPRIHYTQITS